MLTTGSGCSGVGGSSGSGSGMSGSTEGPPAVGDRRSPRRANGFRISSSSSGPGGGSGRGFGMADGRADAAGLLAGDRKKFSSPPVQSSPLPFCSADSAICDPNLPSPGAAPDMPSRLVGRDAGSSVDLSDRDGFGGLPRRRRISGLCLSRLAFVGDAKDGRFLAAVAASVGVDPGAAFDWADASASGCTGIGIELRGDVLRRLGAEVSMVAQLRCLLPEHDDVVLW